MNRVAGSGQYLFVRGSDNGLWISYNGGDWQNLGGTFFGDPTAVFRNGGGDVNVFVLGTDSNIWTYGIHQGTLIGWSSVPSDQTNGQHVFFSSPPKAINPLSGRVPGRKCMCWPRAERVAFSTFDTPRVSVGSKQFRLEERLTCPFTVLSGSPPWAARWMCWRQLRHTSSLRLPRPPDRHHAARRPPSSARRPSIAEAPPMLRDCARDPAARDRGIRDHASRRCRTVAALVGAEGRQRLVRPLD